METNTTIYHLKAAVFHSVPYVFYFALKLFGATSKQSCQNLLSVSFSQVFALTVISNEKSFEAK